MFGKASLFICKTQSVLSTLYGALGLWDSCGLRSGEDIVPVSG